jgi:hypothetical protein
LFQNSEVYSKDISPDCFKLYLLPTVIISELSFVGVFSIISRHYGTS